MRGRNRMVGFKGAPSAITATALALVLSAAAEASDLSRHTVPAHHAPVHLTVQAEPPRFLASRSTNFLATRHMNVLATRNMKVLAAPHQLAPRQSTVIIAPLPQRMVTSHVAPKPKPTGMITGANVPYSSNRAPVYRIVRTGSR